MRLTRCHVDAPLAVGASLALPETAANHLARVLRLREGDACVVFNGDGHDYDARLSTISKREVRAEIIAARSVDNESPLQVTLLQGIARGEKMDLILQKATELGVAAVRPVHSQRSEVKLDEARGAKRLAHWQSVVISACEQSGRAVVPHVAPPEPLAAAIRGLPEGGLRLILDPEATETCATLAWSPGTQVVLAVGPEGGWSPLDREQLLAGGEGFGLGIRKTVGFIATATRWQPIDPQPGMLQYPFVDQSRKRRGTHACTGQQLTALYPAVFLG